ncbi:MAG TPA: Crp/Fnr family transcriptional regulator [Acidimicrobiaceae bacterium]|nr:Crp/Fnr family transcriptional regulator [Acidimicrobiaceae bacterium]
MSTLESELLEHPFLAGLDPTLAARLASLTQRVEFPAGAWIARVGMPADQFLMVTDGRAGIEIAAADMNPLIVTTVHPGEVLGWSWFVEPHEWQFDVVALSELTALAIDAKELLRACAADDELGYQIGTRLIRVVASRLGAARYQLMDVYGSAR